MDCPLKNRFACLKCVAFGPHLKHDCMEIADLQVLVRDYQKSNEQNQSNDQEIQVYNKCIALISQQITEIRIKIDHLLVNLEKGLVGEVNSRICSKQTN